uniref:PH domain-containing protein n=1 Tax=Dendroctonus ponderosae TaxID=77166 RepID=A0AAR5PI78_DENPD
MNTSEKPRDVGGVELLMSNHQSLKAEIDAREDNFTSCISLGKELLSRNHYASAEITDKLVALNNHRQGVVQRWEERWENLQLILEVYQFGRDAAVAEAWLIAQEPYLMSTELGHTIDDVENLIKKHEAFEKSAAAQEERFSALERLTTFEIREMKRREEAEAEERARLEREEAERKAALEAASRPKEPDPASADRPDAGGAAIEERPVHGVQPRPQTVGSTPSPPKPTPRSQTLLRSEEKTKRKDRSRSKSPFRSFRWKKSSPKTHSGAHSDDEGVLASRQECSSPDEEGFEGNLVRKHEWENTTVKASNRSWDKVFVVLRGSHLAFYKDPKTAKSTPDQRFKGEAPLQLHGATASVATDYKKKKHVFRLKLENGGDFLLQAQNDAEMNTWISHINAHADTTASGSSRSQTLPASGQKEDQKRRSFFTLKKT